MENYLEAIFLEQKYSKFSKSIPSNGEFSEIRTIYSY